MGQEETRIMLSNKPIEKITRNFFDFQYVIGKGGFGKVKKYITNNYNNNNKI